MNASSTDPADQGFAAPAAAAPQHPLATLAARAAVLDPARPASRAQDAARALLRQGESVNTRMSYGSACAWFAARYGHAVALPVSSEPGGSGGLGQATAGQKLANPCADPLVRELLARTRRAYAQRGARPKRQRALTKDPLQLLLATCDEPLRGKRDRANSLIYATGAFTPSTNAATGTANRRANARI